MSILCRSKIFTLVVTAFAACAFAVPAFAQQQSDPKAQTNPLLQLLQTKGILTAEEAALVTQASSPADSNQLLARVLLGKGLITQEEYNQTVGASVTPVAAQGFSEARMIPAVLRLPPRNPPGSARVAQTPSAKPEVIPAVAPVRVLPIDLAKQSGLIPDIKLGSGANMKLYGFFKASAVSDTASSGGSLFGSNDFPLPLLLGGDTGPTGDPQVHIKARAFRIGSQFEWVPKNSSVVLTGKVEADFEGDFTNQNSVNISSARNGQFRTRLAWVRLDTKLGGTLPVFAEFGQDWTLYSSSLPTLFESTGTGIGMGALWERAPMFRTGVQFHSGDLKIQPEFAIVLPVAGTGALTDEQRARFGDRAGSESNQPGLESRIVFQFPISHSWQAVAPAQVIVSGHHARINEIIPFGSLPTTVITGAKGCGNAACSIRSFFPQGLQLDSPQNIWTAELQLPTPWVTFVSKYYSGGNLRFPFAGQLNDVFNDLNGTVAIPTNVVAAPLAFDSRPVLFGCAGATTIPTFNCNGSPIVAESFRPVRGSGGFLDASFPLSRIFHADSNGRNSGWVFHLLYGTDRAKARDVRRPGANGLVRTDLESASLTYKLNKWVTFVQETSYIQTRAATPGSKTFRGLPATQAHSWRNEFGTIFTF